MSQSDCDSETTAEEVLSSITHGIGAVLAIVVLGSLVRAASLHGGISHWISLGIFGVALVCVYVSSTLYHACRTGLTKTRLQCLDKRCIYLLIAGTYTPFLLVNVGGGAGWSLLATVWILAAIGVLAQRWLTNQLASTFLYVALGWIGVLGAPWLLAALSRGALTWILAGGLAYSAGVLFYLWDRLPFNHAIWHLFVMAGSACHVLAVWRYVALV